MLNPLYTYILDIYDLVWFYGISTIVGYLMLNPLYTYILNIYDLIGFYDISTILVYLMLNPIYTYEIYMIYKHKSTKLNSSKYYYVSLIIQLNINHL